MGMGAGTVVEVVEMGTGLGMRRGWRWEQRKAGDRDRDGVRDRAGDRDGVRERAGDRDGDKEEMEMRMETRMGVGTGT